MKRSTRVVLAQETLAICEAGEYRSANGRTISIRDELHSAKAGTRLYSLENPPILARKLSTHETQIEVTNETTQSALAKLSSAGHLACLNFSSAKNPGGGFLNGSQGPGRVPGPFLHLISDVADSAGFLLTQPRE